jgi:hypothetical protein
MEGKMSRAFVTENDSWDYCTKAGETCFHAERGRECRRQDCQYVKKSDTETNEQSTDEGAEKQ